ncbi:hypothetical protein VKS41_001637 [Umbelopsis sp. WA50703]
MGDFPGPGAATLALSRKQSTDNTQITFRPPPFPVSNPDHKCLEFVAPDGRYELCHEILFDSLLPNYNIGTTASLVSIKYKDIVNNSKPDGSNLYSNSSSTNTSETVAASNSAESNDSDEENIANSPPIASNNNGGKQMNALRRKFSLTVSSSEPPPSPVPRQMASIEGGVMSNPNPTSTLSFLTRGHTLSGNGKAPRKPKSSITKSNSSFVQRIITNDQLAKILIARTSDDTNLFYNCGTSFVWMDATGNPKEPLSRIIFARSYPTVHDVNMLTRGADHLDVIIGFSTGDILWFDPLSNKYARINKALQGVMNSSAVTCIKWLPGSENLFMASFYDGCCMLFDKEREDSGGVFTLETNTVNGLGNGSAILLGNAKPRHGSGLHHSIIEGFQEDLTLRVSKPNVKASHKCNPVSHWSVSKKPVHAFAFSPDFQHVAMVGLDGRLRIIDFLTEKSDVYQTYYGGLICVAWSPDGRYILTGGQDDLVTIWAFREQRIVARCQGHTSWVTSVAFDSYRCDENVYRFGSVGEDAKLILWDFSVSALHRPKTQKQSRHRGASVSSFSNPVLGHGSGFHDRPPTLHPALEKTRVAFLQPVMVQTIHADPCVGLYFREDVVVTTDRRGRVTVWKRPS